MNEHPAQVSCPECGSPNASEDKDGTLVCSDCGYVRIP
ncbi:MAG: hypothetical protein JO011_00720 [Ktedonobacteraceae bacterium]|nr:hypothetical protein [Ktedonobacteraceae bacterium]